MELPTDIKNLYRHFPLHVANRKGAKEYPVPQELKSFIDERIKIWEQKVSGASPPYTNNPILAKYRFCNIFRELDRQTIEFHTLLNPLRRNFPLWLLNIFYARVIARPETIRAAGLLSFDKEENLKLYKRLVALPRPRFGTPYVFPISVIQKSKTPTRELFITEYLPSVMKKAAQEIERWGKMPVYDGVKKIIPIFGFNFTFLWTEVLIDAAYQFPDRIDLFKRFPIGPGSMPTFEKLSPAEDPSIFAEKLATKGVTTSITYKGKRLVLSAENWEGIGCEYRKYKNLSDGKGRKRIYNHLRPTDLNTI